MPNLTSANLYSSLARDERSQELYLMTSRLTLLHQPLLDPQIFIYISELEIHMLQGRSQLLTSLYPVDSSGCKVAEIGADEGNVVPAATSAWKH